MTINYNYVFIKSYRNNRTKITYCSENIITDIEELEEIALELAGRDCDGSESGWKVFYDLDFYYLDHVKL